MPLLQETYANEPASILQAVEDSNANKLVPYSCMFIDANLSDFLRAFKGCLAFCPALSSSTPSLRSHLADAIERKFCSEAKSRTEVATDAQCYSHRSAVVCLSVRTGFDLFLRCMSFPVGSEIVMTAVNIPGMVEIVRAHGLVVVPWDISPDTLLPSTDRLLQLINHRTVAVLVAHLYGRFNDLTDIIQFVHQHKLWFIEDCAEVFAGFRHLGNVNSDVVLFSFGVIKHQTCFGGAVMIVRDSAICAQLRLLHSTYPVQQSSAYLAKVLKYAGLAFVLNSPAVMWPGMAFFRRIHFDYKRLFVSLLRGFPSDMLARIRAQPCDALVQMMFWRLVGADDDRGCESRIAEGIALARAKGDFVVQELRVFHGAAKGLLTIPGLECLVRNYWLFPVLVKDPVGFSRQLNERGIDAYMGATQLTLVVEEKDLKDTTQTPYAKEMINRTVYLPIQKNVPFSALKAICRAVKAVLRQEDASLLLKSKL